MANYVAEPPYQHGTAAVPGILLVNLGTPEAPTPAALRAYLREFLSDPRVVEISRALWVPILHAVILRTRPSESAKRYAAVWSPDGSPLKVHTARQATLLRGYLGERTRSRIEVEWAMRYGKPAVRQGLESLKARGCDRILVLPLYPQYSASTTAAVFDAVAAALKRMRNIPAVRFVKHFHDHPGYIDALAQSIRDYWMQTGRPDQLVMSFHGVPRFTLDKGDPYHCECQATGRLLAQALGLTPERYRISFQSRFGRAEWLKPYTADVLVELGRAHTARVDVVCPGFVSDCLETLEEIALEGKSLFLGAGGQSFHYIACLNERNDWLKALTDIAWNNLHGWMEAPTAEALAGSRARAIALGAKD
ncbi:MAG: ferrochelatase [Betaproteobacteria bacterium]|nr:MAG: ferrochelatase [Betaproteobacteria bacterium]